MGKKKKNKYKKRFALSLSRELKVIAFCLSVVYDFQNDPSKQEDPEFFGVYATAMEILSLLGVEAHLEINPDDLGFKL